MSLLSYELELTEQVIGRSHKDFDGIEVKNTAFPHLPVHHRPVEVGGMMKAGKTTLIEGFVSNFNTPVNYLPELVHFAVERGSISSFPIVMTELMKETLVMELLNMVAGVDSGDLPIGPVICERSWVDALVWRRTLFVQGQAKYDESRLSLKHALDIIHPNEFSWSYVLCLISPEEYRKRGGSKYEPEFVTALYYQYLRLCQEVIEGDYRLNLLCLDTSSPDIPLLQEKFKIGVLNLIDYSV